MTTTPPDALLFVAPGCMHCHAVQHALEVLVQQGVIGKMSVVDVAAHPAQAAEFGVRAAPWLRLGPFTLSGAHSLAELRQWAEWASGEAGVAHYVEHLLRNGSYQQAVAFIAADTQRLQPVLAIMVDPDTGIDVRLGASGLLERYAQMPELQKLLPQLAELSSHADHRVRADACHLLGLTGSKAARTYVETCLGDANAEVREIAQEALGILKKRNA